MIRFFAIILMVFGPKNPVIWVLGPLGFWWQRDNLLAKHGHYKPVYALLR